jgi:predicted MFS family arabinose efflux permease
MNGMIVALGLAMGPSLGGLLADAVGWRAIFFINVPIGIAAYLWCRYLLPDFRSEKRQRFDWPGAVLAFCGLGALLLSVSRGEVYNWSWPILVLGLVALSLLSWFVVVEKRSPEPMLDLNLFHIRAFAAGNLAALLNFMTQYIIVFLTPFLLQQAMGLSAGRAGATMTAFPLTVLVVAPLAGSLSDKIGQRGLALTGSLICTVAALLLAGLGQHSGTGDVGLASWPLRVGHGAIPVP